MLSFAYLDFRAARARYAAAVERETVAPGSGGTELDGSVRGPRSTAAGAGGDEPSGYNGYTRCVLETVAGCLRPKTGYLWQAHGLMDAVTAAAPGCEAAEALTRWRERVAVAHAEVVAKKRHLLSRNIMGRTRDSALINAILVLARPMDALGELRDRARTAWEDAARHATTERRRAAALRDYLLIALLCCAPLRRRHWEILQYSADGRGHLRRITDSSRSDVGHYEIFFPRSAFKALADFRDADYLAAVPFELTPLLDLYLSRYWPVLGGGTDRCAYVFQSSTKKKAGDGESPGAAEPMAIDALVASITGD
jgi:hypothetical protein